MQCLFLICRICRLIWQKICNCLFLYLQYARVTYWSYQLYWSYIWTLSPHFADDRSHRLPGNSGAGPAGPGVTVPISSRQASRSQWLGTPQGQPERSLSESGRRRDDPASPRLNSALTIPLGRTVTPPRLQSAKLLPLLHVNTDPYHVLQKICKTIIWQKIMQNNMQNMTKNMLGFAQYAIGILWYIVNIVHIAICPIYTICNQFPKPIENVALNSGRPHRFGQAFQL